jgi:hypothetical protein
VRKQLRDMGDLMLILFALAMAFIVLFSAFGCARHSEVCGEGEEILYCEPLAVPEPPPIDDESGG